MGSVATGTALLERDVELDVLDTALHRAAAGEGSVVLISGEAGIGKTSVVRRSYERRRIGLPCCTARVTTC
jgi:predicted ATPase